MNDLAGFLLDRIAEDEAEARAATPGPWEWDRTPHDEWGHQPPDLVTVAKRPPFPDGSVSPVGIVVSSYGYDMDGVEVSDEDAAHIARHDPARALAECEAKRRIVEEWRSRNVTGGWFSLACLALPYADHPDYREEWRP